MANLNLLINNWFIILAVIILIVLYTYKNNKNLNTRNIADIETWMETIFWGTLILTFQTKLFASHGYFILGIIIFTPLWFIIISLILAGRKKVLIESRIQGEKYYKMGLMPKDMEEIIVTDTGIRVHILDDEYYDNIKHYGSQGSPYTNVGNNVKHCDYFDGETSYHPENPFVHNITYWADNVMWRTLKNVIPKIQYANMMLTELFNVNLHEKMGEMRKTFPFVLLGTESQYTDKPFPVEKTMKEEMKSLMAETTQSLTDKESNPETEE